MSYFLSFLKQFSVDDKDDFLIEALQIKAKYSFWITSTVLEHVTCKTGWVQ